MLLALPKGIRRFLNLFTAPPMYPAQQPVHRSAKTNKPALARAPEQALQAQPAPLACRIQTLKFEKQRIRVAHVDGQPWIVDRDLLAQLETEPTAALPHLFDRLEYNEIPGSGLKGFSHRGVLRLLAQSTHYNAIRLDLWLQRNVFVPSRRAARR